MPFMRGKYLHSVRKKIYKFLHINGSIYRLLSRLNRFAINKLPFHIDMVRKKCDFTVKYHSTRGFRVRFLV